MNKQLLAIISTLAILSQFNLSSQPEDEMTSMFSQWKVKYAKTYPSNEESYRLSVFTDNKKKIDHNNAQGNTHTEALNQFSDLTAEEFKQIYLSGFKPTLSNGFNSTAEVALEAPKSLDWRQRGAVTGVKNQGQCGSCWAFGTVGGIEGRYFLTTNKLQSFSEQQINSCDKSDGGCNGGNLQPAYNYVENNGLESEEDYPYTSGGGNTGSCEVDDSKLIIKKQSLRGNAVQPNSKNAYVNALATQPLSICAAAGAFQSYSGGILSTACDQSVDHCVTGVAYDLTGDVPFATIKNSWGTSWGESGYVRVSMADDAPASGYCAIYSVPYTATYSQ